MDNEKLKKNKSKITEDICKIEDDNPKGPLTVESGDLFKEDYVQKFQDQVGSYLLDTDTLEEKMEKIGRLKQIIDMMQGTNTETKLGNLIEAEEMKPNRFQNMKKKKTYIKIKMK